MDEDEDSRTEMGTDYAPPQQEAPVQTAAAAEADSIKMLKTLEQELTRGLGSSMPLFMKDFKNAIDTNRD